MADIRRQSPATLAARVMEAENRDHWQVVLTYADEGKGPHLADLSHLARWDLQDGDLSRFSPGGVDVPEAPGCCAMKDGVLVNRMNRTQAAVWHLAEKAPALPKQAAYTDVTEASVFLALFGPNVFSVTEKLTSLDFFAPGKTPPFLLQGPFSHVPCQIVALAREEGGGILLACSRGYGRDMADAILAAGAPVGLRPAGEKAFFRWLAGI